MQDNQAGPVSDIFVSKKFVLTGELESMTRKDAKKYIANNYEKMKNYIQSKIVRGKIREI